MYSRIILLFLFSFISQISMSSNFDINTKKIIGAKSNQEEWITHGRTYSEERFSGLKQINEKNQYSLQKKDGLYFPSLTEFTIENLNEYDAKIILCVGL